jgi:hypothetical protein
MKITRRQLRRIITEELGRIVERQTILAVPPNASKWLGNTKIRPPKLGRLERETLAINTKEKWDAAKSVKDFEKVMTTMKTDLKDYMPEGSQIVVQFVGGMQAGIDMWKKDGVKPEIRRWGTPGKFWIPKPQQWYSMSPESIKKRTG